MTVDNSTSRADVPGGQLILWKPSLNTMLVVAITFLVASWPFIGALSWLWTWWLDVPEYSHGIIVPCLTATLIWLRRDEFLDTPFSGSWWGVGLVALAAIVYWIGTVATLHVVDNLGYWLLLCGITLSLLGPRAFRIVRLPLLLLVFAIPLPNFFLNNLSATLQLWSSQLGVQIIRGFGISVLLQGNVIDLGLYRLEVAEACSGLRYLFPLLTLGMLMGYLYRGALWKRVAIALVSLPLTVLVNSLRIGLIGFMVDRWGPGMAEGFVHDAQGWVMFMLTGGLMVLLLMALHRFGRERLNWHDAFGISPPAERPPGAVVRRTTLPKPFWGTIALVAVISLASWLVPAPREVYPDRTAFVGFPMRLGDWKGRSQGLEQGALDILQLDDYLLADYVAPKGDAVVNLYVAYYKAQHSSQAVHSPRSCLPGGGWVMTDFGQREIPGVVISGNTLRVNRAIVELGNQRELVYYWFQQRGRIVTNEFAVKWYLLVDSLLRHRTDGALVRLVTLVPAGASAQDADRRLGEMASELAPVLPTYVAN